ncbi:MAG TPA: glycerophosphodiester phosphodiesterase family protein, partial [Geminicoccaceae bacterium]|nr:glycerophosphodiester phosphodiesterase family protein [Geminicoccaceae bacterium]
MPEGISLDHRGRRIALKWHMLRREPSDPAHWRPNLALALERGATAEIDLVFSADGEGVCLHDLTLDRETTGRGPARARSAEELRALRQRGRDNAPTGKPPLLLREVVAAARAAPVPPAPGSIQIDLKEPHAALNPVARRRFAETLGDAAGWFTLAGCEWPAVTALAAAAPGVRLGFDPLDFHEHAPPETPDGFRALAALTLATAPEASILYLEADLVLRGLAHGINVLEPLRAAGKDVDCWTVDPDRPHLIRDLEALFEAGANQITTNAPEAIEALWRRAKGAE